MGYSHDYAFDCDTGLSKKQAGKKFKKTSEVD
jgi:hypothetical protein